VRLRSTSIASSVAHAPTSPETKIGQLCRSRPSALERRSSPAPEHRGDRQPVPPELTQQLVQGTADGPRAGASTAGGAGLVIFRRSAAQGRGAPMQVLAFLSQRRTQRACHALTGTCSRQRRHLGTCRRWPAKPCRCLRTPLSEQNLRPRARMGNASRAGDELFAARAQRYATRSTIGMGPRYDEGSMVSWRSGVWMRG